MSKMHLDSCIVIYLIQGTETIHHQITDQITSIPVGRRTLCFSDLTRLECLVKPIKEEDDDLIKQYNDFFSLPSNFLLPFNTKIFDLATNLRAKWKIKTPDALHLANAIVWKCDEFWTNDEHLLSVAENQIHIVDVFNRKT